MSTDHTDPGPLEGLIPPELLLTMNGGEPAIVCLRVEHLDAARGFDFDVGDDPTFSTSVARFGGGRLANAGGRRSASTTRRQDGRGASAPPVNSAEARAAGESKGG